MTTEKKRQLPWGLNPESITPGSMKTISKEKLKAFSVGNMNTMKQKSSVLKKKEELEERKRMEEEKQAKVYEDFIREFEHDAPKAKTFVKGDVINSDSKTSGRGKIYNPAGMKKMEELNTAKLLAAAASTPPSSANKKPDKPKKRQKDQDKKKSNLEMFKEELKQQQAERGERHRLKKLGIIPMSAPEMIGSAFQPAPPVKDQLALQEGGSAAKFLSASYLDPSIDDPYSTNLYVGNLAMEIDEEQLSKIFGLHGPLASVKIMWPRNEEERKRDRNCGFVAFMTREDAEKAQVGLNGREFEGFSIKVGWGSSVPIPPHPIYIPPHLVGDKSVTAMTTTGLPFNAVPRKTNVRAPLILPHNQHDANELLRECIVYVVFPHDKATLNRINRVAQFVINEGPMFEAMIMNKEINNPDSKYQFLFNNNSAEHCYYRWRLFSLLQGETFEKWRTEEFRMFKNGSMWKPPPYHSKAELMVAKQLAGVAVEGNDAKRGQLNNSQRDKLEDMLRGITAEKEDIGNCMHWCLTHADAAAEIVDCISESLSILQTPPTVKAARLFLCNDLLYNSCAAVQNASSYRTKFESKLSEIVINLKATLDEIKTVTSREKFRCQVTGCLGAWREWNVYSPDFLVKLEIIWSGGTTEKIQEDTVDGLPLDVDGVPLSKDCVDGVPMELPQISDDEEDMFDMTPKKKSSGSRPPIKSKWETSAATTVPSMGSKWESSRTPALGSNRTPALGSKWERSEPARCDKKKGGAESDDIRKKKREIEVKVAEYIDKLESGRCTRIKQITTNEQSEIYRYLLYKGKDAKKTIKHIATGKQSLTELQTEMKRHPLSSPVINTSSKGSLSGLCLVNYGSSPSPSRSPSPEAKRKRDQKRRSNSPKHDRKKKSRH